MVVPTSLWGHCHKYRRPLPGFEHKKRAAPKSGSFDRSTFPLNLGNDLRDPRPPVRQLRPRVATAEIGCQPGVESARLVYVFRRDPDGVAVARRRAVVSPPRPGSVCGSWVVPGETIILPSSFPGDMNVPHAELGVDACIPGARVVVVPQYGEGHHAA